MPTSESKQNRGFTEAARLAAQKTRAAKAADPDSFGRPELFIVKAGEKTFTWELRRFGGVVLQRGLETFPSIVLARADGEVALAVLSTTADQSKFKRDLRWKSAPVAEKHD